MGGLYRHCSVMQAGWNVVECPRGACFVFVGRRRKFSPDFLALVVRNVESRRFRL